MKFFIAGLGSMGKRRIRNLQYLKEDEIIGCDIRKDRRDEAENKYGIKTTDDIRNIDPKDYDVLIISTPPDVHKNYIRLAIKNKKPAFVEASVTIDELEKLNELAKKNKSLIAPSCTLRFHPAIKMIKDIVASKKYGKVTNFTYHSGQYLPDWHPWEKVKDYYVSKKETGGGREIVPFELTWMVDVFGFPKNITGFYGRTMDVGAEIDDTYAISLDFGTCYGNLLVDVTSRYATRQLTLNMEHGQLTWRWDEDHVSVFDANKKEGIKQVYNKGDSAVGYNKNIIEEMYIEELTLFIDAVKGKGTFPNTLDDDIKVLEQLYKMEGSK